MVGVARQPYCRVAATLGTRFHIVVLPLDPIFKCHMLSALLACGLGVAAQPLPQTTTRAASASAQQTGFPIELVAPGKGPFTFPAGYQTPWEQIQILVTSKMSPNLFVLHGSEALDNFVRPPVPVRRRLFRTLLA